MSTKRKDQKPISVYLLQKSTNSVVKWTSIITKIGQEILDKKL
jgi:hypothetical protein